MQNIGRNPRKANELSITPVRKPYIGRFAPSPTGPLHLGSLFAALASFLQARAQQGKWLLRIDDIDTPRNIPGAADNIIKTLEKFGLFWDDEIFYQSRHLQTYHSAITVLTQNLCLYRCLCSRKALAAYHQQHPESSVYPGFCREKTIPEQSTHALRLKTSTDPIQFEDILQGSIKQNLALQQGDFVVQRKDNIIAYQLAVVIDDYQQQVTQVVRGIDLLQSTVKQIHIQQQLNYPSPEYMHIPIITDASGHKLSKQSFAQAANSQHPGKVLLYLLKLMQQDPPQQLIDYPVQDIISWAVQHWQPARLKKMRAISEIID